MNNINFIKNPGIRETVRYLISQGLPALPVAPVQNDEKYCKRHETTGEIERDKKGNPKPMFTGKNPSCLDENGIPHPVYHSRYKSRLPNESDLKKWFANPENGIGTLGGYHQIVFIDIDTI